MNYVMRNIIVATMLLISNAATADKLCCKCGGFWAETTPGPLSRCSIACSASGGASSGQSKVVPNEAYCANAAPSNPETPVRPVTQDEVVRESLYAIYHQGASIWAERGGEMLKGEQLRHALTFIDSKDNYALAHASAELLQSGAELAVQQCINEVNISADFAWVCSHEGQAGDIRSRASQGNFYAVRSVFSMHQRHNDELRNRIYCRDDDAIKFLVANFCPNPSPRPPIPNLMPKERNTHP